MKTNINYLLRLLPKVDDILSTKEIINGCADKPYSIVIESVRTVIDTIRRNILSENINEIPDMSDIFQEIISLVCKKTSPSLVRVINGTGIILHTNLGRAK